MTVRSCLPALLLPAVVFISSCDRGTEKTEVLEEAIEEVEGDLPVLDEPSSLSPEERAELLGFAARLSPETEGVMALYDGAGMVEALRGLGFWQLARRTIEEEQGSDPEELIGEQGELVRQLLGEEMFLAAGSGAAEQMKAWNRASGRINYYQFRLLAQAFASAVVEGDPAAITEAFTQDEALAMDMLHDLDRLMPLIEELGLPPILAGLRISDEQARTQAAGQISDSLGFLAGMGEPVTIEKAGAVLGGIELKGATLSEMLAADADDIDAEIGRENREKLLEAIAGKNIVIASGVIDDYLLLYLGSDAESCPIVDAADESLVAGDALSFIDSCRELPVHGLLYGSEELVASGTYPTFGDLARGIRDGLAGVQGFGDTREIGALLDLVAEKEEALLALHEADELGGVITIDGGARFELFGGLDAGMIDPGAEHRMAGLAEGESVLLFANWAAGEEYEQRAGEFGEALVEVAYALTSRLANVPGGGGDMAMFQAQFQLFDSVFREDVVKLWDSLAGLDEGLGNEEAVLIDLAGEVPPIPGVPVELVEGGRFPRLAYMAPVEERAKLGESWTGIETSLRAVLEGVREMGGGEVALPRPTSSEKDEVATWYFDALAFSDDVKPSATVSDDWFVLSSSRTQALGLVEAVGAEPETERGGLWMRIDLDTLREYGEQTLALIDEHSMTILPSEAERREFEEAKPVIRESLEALGEFAGVSLHYRIDDDRWRTTLQFEAR